MGGKKKREMRKKRDKENEEENEIRTNDVEAKKRRKLEREERWG